MQLVKYTMNLKLVLLAVASLIIIAACGSGSGLPDPTGKANFRAINAIERSPAVSFKIEEFSLGNIEFQDASTTSSYDDFDYMLNFDVVFAGDATETRIISQFIDTQADQDYTLLLSGTIAAPTITVWETPVRTFDTGATVFEARFAHAASAAATLDYDSVDYYFAADGVVPVMGEAVASSLTFTDITAPAEFETGDYVLTITTAGDPADILYTSDPVTITPQRNLIINLFDGSAVSTAPVLAHALGAVGSSILMPDSSFLSTIEFLHGSQELGSVDIYDDEGLTMLVAQNHDYQQSTGPIVVESGPQTFRYTPTGMIAPVSIEATVTVLPGFRYRITAAGLTDEFTATFSLPDRRPIDTGGKLSSYHTSDNFEFVNFYIISRGEILDAQTPFRVGLPAAVTSEAAAILPGSYDLYLREFGETEILAGPIALDIANGDVYEVLGFDSLVDPAILDVQLNALQ